MYLPNNRSQQSGVILVVLVLAWINSHLKDDNQCIGFAYRFQVPTTETAIDISVSQINKSSKDKKMADFNQATFLISLLWLTLDTLCRNWTEKFHPPCTHITVAANFHACPSRSHWLDICPRLDSIWLSWADFREKMDQKGRPHRFYSRSLSWL